MFNLLQTQKYFEIKGNASRFGKMKKKEKDPNKMKTDIEI